MRNRTRLLALAVVVVGGGTLASPRAAHATYNPPPTLGPQYCCCEVTAINTCGNRCCSPRGCTITSTGCTTARL
jgi:hypothetical protein